MNQGCIAGRPVCNRSDRRRFPGRRSESMGSMTERRKDQAFAGRLPRPPLQAGSKMIKLNQRSRPVRARAARVEGMSQIDGLTEAGLKTPKAAAIAGVVFSLLTLASFGLLWSAIPADPRHRARGSPPTRAWLRSRSISCRSPGSLFCGSSASFATSSASARIAFLRPCFSAAASCSWGCCSSPRRSRRHAHRVQR